ncbi:hypothetical protein [Niabella drilacis]|uniref:Uncharacterized protein n=1 Tax=Niabella drilacis (strain DSM 25811 / CCM 8410 / CCUG 62505 / LMG 26954 / E90) TaxID=1285928 RepID=A0A1G6QBX3_NIADE|nr:hypothetical protein [Niabella drilacis]SDC89783.1 hypothetical protein SAMN04487894_104351 [Niabella drilacis]
MIHITKKIAGYYWSLYLLNDHAAGVTVYADNNENLGYIRFGADNAVPIPNQYMDNRFTINLKWSNMSHVIDLLRNEGPVYIHITIDDNNKLNYAEISTQLEPAGDGEL